MDSENNPVLARKHFTFAMSSGNNIFILLATFITFFISRKLKQALIRFSSGMKNVDSSLDLLLMMRKKFLSDSI